MPKVFNNQVFIDFLAQLRPDEQHQYNSKPVCASFYGAETAKHG